MAERFPGGVISKTPPTVTPPTGGEGGSASGVWSLDEVLGYEKVGGWPKPPFPFELYGWGNNNSGFIGNNSTATVSSPIKVGGDVDWNAVSVEGAAATVALKKDGTLWAWGFNNYGQVGDNTIIRRSSPVQIGALTNWAQADTTGYFTNAIKTDGTLWSWGVNYFPVAGVLGDNTNINRSSPIQIGALTNWAKISNAYGTTLATTTSGELYAWGRNNWGQIGDGTASARSSPVQVGALTNWEKLSNARDHSFAIKTDGTLWAWGRNGPRLGLNDTASRSSPVQVGALTDWAEISAFNSGAIAIKTDGTLWSWGYNFGGELGLNNSFVTYSSPVQIGALTNWAKLSPQAADTNAAIKTDGTLWTWGYGTNRQIGDGGTSNKSSPTQIGTGITWNQVSIARFGALAISGT